jgi:hypothetical protein
MSLGETALHAATSQQHRDASLDAGAKALVLLEGATVLVGLALAGDQVSAVIRAVNVFQSPASGEVHRETLEIGGRAVAAAFSPQPRQRDGTRQP